MTSPAKTLDALSKSTLRMIRRDRREEVSDASFGSWRIALSNRDEMDITVPGVIRDRVLQSPIWKCGNKSQYQYIHPTPRSSEVLIVHVYTGLYKFLKQVRVFVDPKLALSMR